MTVYIPKMLRLLYEAQRQMIHGDLDVERKDKNSLDARPSKSNVKWTNPGVLW